MKSYLQEPARAMSCGSLSAGNCAF